MQGRGLGRGRGEGSEAESEGIVWEVASECLEL